MLKGTGVVHAVRHREQLGVVGDGDIFEAAEEGGFGHFADGVCSIRFEGVHVNVATQV